MNTPIVGADEETKQKMRNHVTAMEVCRQGHVTTMQGAIARIQIELTKEDNREALRRKLAHIREEAKEFSAEEAQDVMTELGQLGDHDPVHEQLIMNEIAIHTTAIDTIACQFAFLHAMGVPDIPVPAVPDFAQGETVQ